MKKIKLLKYLLVLTVAACSADHDGPYLGESSIDSTTTGGGSKGCANRLSGTWNFGQTPYGCEMPQAATKTAEANYSEYVYYPDTNDKETERKRYVQAMNDYIKNTSEEYLLRREPDVTNEAMEAWVLLALSIAHQESYWTHYRIGEDNVFRLLKGDNYHGYGLMQVDDRWHKEFIASGDVFDLKLHIIYALDLMYSVRANVLKKPCSGEKNWDTYNRSIYSAYNGGLGSKCRWKNQGDKWYKNDKGFLVKYVKRAWEAFLNIIKGSPEESTAQKEEEDKNIENKPTTVVEEAVPVNEDEGVEEVPEVEAEMRVDDEVEEKEVTDIDSIEEVVDHEG